RSSARHMPTINTMTAIDRVSAANSSAIVHRGPGWSTAYTTGGSATTWPHTARTASTPSTEPSNWAILYGMTPAPGKTPKRHMASEMAGFICPPDALPIGLRISPARSNATPAPTSTRSAWICGMDREMSEGPITHLTILATPKSSIEVRMNSYAVFRPSWTNATRSACLWVMGASIVYLLRLRRTSPTEQKLYIAVLRIVTTRTSDDVSDPEPDHLNSAGKVWRDRPFSTNLTIESRPPSART